MEKNKGGRPLLFESAEELQQKIDEYFDSCYEERWTKKTEDGIETWHAQRDRQGEIIKDCIRPYTISGLAVHLKTSRQTLLNYEEREEYFDTITRAKAIIENFAEEQLFDKNARNIGGIQFNLSNNYKKWANKTELDHSGGLVMFKGEDVLED